MAGITISGMEEQNKKPAASTGSGNSSGKNYSSGGNTGTTAVTVKPTPQATGISGVTTTDVPGSEVKVTLGAGEGTGRYVGSVIPSDTNVGGASAPAAAETTLADLREQYANQLRDSYNYSADRMKAERDEALRENWILQQQAEAALPEQMAARGINGGATETTLADLRARYQGDRNQLRGNYMDEMGELAQSHNQQIAEQNRSYNERWLDYLLSLAEMEEQHKKNLELQKY